MRILDLGDKLEAIRSTSSFRAFSHPTTRARGHHRPLDQDLNAQPRAFMMQRSDTPAFNGRKHLSTPTVRLSPTPKRRLRKKNCRGYDRRYRPMRVRMEEMSFEEPTTGYTAASVQ